MKSSRVIFNKKALSEAIFANLAEEQTRRLIAYASSKVVEIGNMISSYHSRNHMDRTGNLLNSLCWGVSYNGKLVESGFYRDSGGRGGTSYLHEWTPESAEEVDGRARAQAFLESQKNKGGSNWRVFFAILAPYWGYWESGFKMKSGGGREYGILPRTVRYRKFAVMSHYITELRKDLKPNGTTFTVYVDKYSYVSNKFRGKKRKLGYKKLYNRASYYKHMR